ncbi:RRXRR domain-containing protein [Brasilonema sp. CT11]|nr:RRXRR domain-containing protein [Brasilonema sp. CT11]
MSNYVFLIDANKTQLNPVHPKQACKLMESGKAAVFRHYPFTLIQSRAVANVRGHRFPQSVVRVARGRGFSLVTDRKGGSGGMDLEGRGQGIRDVLEPRRAVRRARRSRNTRYRKARFLNRRRVKGWLAPSLVHRVLTTETWVKRLCKFAPIAEIRQELVRFDTQQLENPEISGTEYQQGTLYGYEVREYLLEKWGRKCTYCSKENTPLQIEHITARGNGGSNRVSNLCLACEKCNQKKGTKDLKDFLKGKPDLVAKILKQSKVPLKDASAVNSTRWKLFEVLRSTKLPVTTGTGGQTKYNRTRLGLAKEHWLGAACVGVTESLKILTQKILRVKATGFGTRRLCRIDKFGFPCSNSRQTYNTPWKTGDIGRTTQAIVGRVVVQNEKRLEIRVNGVRHYCKPHKVKPMHRKDGYSYAEI